MNKLVHFEIPADDLKRAGEFYSKVFGWKITSMPEMNYTIINTGPDEEQGQKPYFINGGMFKRKDLPHPVFTMDVENVDESVKLAEANGAKVVRPKVKVGDMGYIAYVTDTEGNHIGIWQEIKK